MNSVRMIVGIAGGTASGKSLLTKGLVEQLGPDRVLEISHDRYYRPLPQGKDPATHNFDEPAALDSELLVQQLQALLRGEAVQLPRYDFSRHARATGVDVASPREVVIVEGLFVLTEARLRALFDQRVFVRAPADVRLGRRVVRDTVERGRTPEMVVQQYMDTVRPMHEAWIEPAAAHADVVVDGTAPPAHLLAQVMTHLGL